ncbi:MAG: ATP synthase F1 subunit epsilon [Acidobacteria bacterium]|nr:ATP synthase F1 subunit epsilon [Acidobacteriota bacterium]
MAAHFKLEIATPERELVHENVTAAQVPGEQGYMGILPGHAPLLSELGIGPLTYTLMNGNKHTVGVYGGFLEVYPGGARVLASEADHPNEIDAARAEAALKRANERLLNPRPGVDIARALNAARRAKARLKLSGYGGIAPPGE